MDPNSPNSNHGDESYSVDAMMARLKKSERQKRHSDSADSNKEGKLVTRDDGSQVVKVRKRKRRSKQAEKKQPTTNPKLKWAILGSIIALLVILAAGTIFIIAKYNGRKFKESTESTISDLTSADSTTITQLRVTPVSAKASKTELAWNKHSFLQSAKFSSINAKIKATSFFTSDWIGEEVVGDLGEIYLQTPLSHTETTSDPIVSPYNFATFRCNQLDLHFGQERDAPSITGLNNVALHKQASGIYHIVFQNGLMKIKNWPELTISSGIALLKQHHTEIEALLKAGENYTGELTIKGRIPRSTTQAVVLDIKAKDYPIQELLGKGLGRIIKGDIRSDMGSLSYNYKKPTADALSFIMPFNTTELRMSELPMFTDLKNLTSETRYLRPIFNHCRGTIMRTSEGITLNDLKLISSSLLSMQGNISVNAKGDLSGTLTVGIPKRQLDKKSPPRAFTGPHDGFYSTTVTLSGSIHNPNDNLSELLNTDSPKIPTAIPQAGPEIAPKKPLGRNLEKEFDDLLR